MASAFPTTASAASAAKDCPPSHRNRLPIQRKVSFLLSSMPRLRFSSKSLQSGWNVCTVRKGQSNKAALGGSLNATTPLIKAELETEDKAANSSSVPSSPALASEESISEFIGQVANLVKLVDSRDIVELQLKQLDCELLIRKKEALPQSASPAPSYMMHSPPPTAAAPTHHALPSPATPAPSPSAASPPSPPASPPAVKSSLPSLKSPMAGTFYRSPAPTEPPFVKVGDKVQKGQVLCIIEAMKLMNEIEADQSGTIVEIVAEDGKPVSVDTPLFVIES